MSTSRLDTLRAMLPKGSTVYLVLRRVAPSGMSRNISPLAIVNGEPRDISRHVLAVGVGYKPRGNGDGVRMAGAGMDMGFSLVYDLAHTLYGDGYALTHQWV